MVLTWEDAYYDNPDYDSSEIMCCQKTLEQIVGGADFSHDPLGLVVAKMSNRVYSLGEGIVGQVAVTGKHHLICEDNQVTSSDPSFKFADGWQSQFSAGIRTILVVSVGSLGVVQLGSLNKVIKDMGVINHIRNLFLTTQDYTIGHLPSQIHSVKNSSSLLDVSTKTLSSKVTPAYLHDTENTMKSETQDTFTPFQYPGKNYSPRAVSHETAVDVTKHDMPDFNGDRSSILLQTMSNRMKTKQQKFVGMRPVNERNFEGNNNFCQDTSLKSETNVSSLLNDLVRDDNSVDDLICLSEKVAPCFPSDFLSAVSCESDKLHYVDIKQKRVLYVPIPPDTNSQKDIEKSNFQTEPCFGNTSSSMKFPAGYELHEALGPGFMKGSKYFDQEAQGNQDVEPADKLDENICYQLTSESHKEHLLEAMVTNVFHYSNSYVNSELSFSTSTQAAMASATNPENSIHTVNNINSEGCSIDHPSLVREEKQHSLSSSGICDDVISPKSFSSTCRSSCSKQFEKSSEPAKKSKKRSRPRESRPRPRDRQLIQDRIKELRELVLNGAKCSIDSLLECTIKHMLFLQSITKHAGKLNKYVDAKTKGQNNRNLHRLDILWPLVLIAIEEHGIVYVLDFY